MHTQASDGRENVGNRNNCHVDINMVEAIFSTNIAIIEEI